jgi:hypothetical protein
MFLLYNFLRIDSRQIDFCNICYKIMNMGNIIIGSVALLGFAIGRYADKYLGYLEKVWILPVPHHWIWGFLILILFEIYLFLQRKLNKMGNLSLRYKIINWCLFLFSIGLFISDFNDFLHLRFFGEEPFHIWNFWSIE